MVGGLHYAVVFEKKGIMNLPISDVLPMDILSTGMRWPEKNFGTSELRDNPDLMLVDFAMLEYNLKQYEENINEIDWTKLPAARMIVSIENGHWAGRLLSIE